MVIIVLSAAGREVGNDDATWQYLSAVGELEYEENAATKPNAVEAEEAIYVANKIESRSDKLLECSIRGNQLQQSKGI